MNKVLYKAKDWADFSDRHHVQCDDLVGTGRNWIEPARIIGVTPTEFILMLKNSFDADIRPYRRDGKITFIDYSWSRLQDARSFRNFINECAREKDYKI